MCTYNFQGSPNDGQYVHLALNCRARWRTQTEVFAIMWGSLTVDWSWFCPSGHAYHQGTKAGDIRQRIVRLLQSIYAFEAIRFQLVAIGCVVQSHATDS